MQSLKRSLHTCTSVQKRKKVKYKVGVLVSVLDSSIKTPVISLCQSKGNFNLLTYSKNRVQALRRLFNIYFAFMLPEMRCFFF